MSPWYSPPETFILGYDEVHVWRATLDLPVSSVQALELILASQERARARQFHFPKDRMHFIVAHGILRTILSCYLARDRRSLQFCHGQYGKPTLVRESENDALSFNMTHSRGMALYAITRSRDIGVDLEYINTDVAYEQIAEQFFSPYEVSMLRALPTSMQREAFFSCWTRKEAYLKARGAGLSLDLRQFDVSVTPRAPAAILRTREEGEDISRWSLHDIFPGSGYVAALVVEGPACHVKCWQWPLSELVECTSP